MITAHDIMSKKVISIESTVSATEIAKLMDRNKVSCIVLTKNDKPYGMVTERDLLTKITALNKKSSELSATEVMTSPITTVSSMTPIEEVAEKMISNKMRRVVVADNEQPVGIITVTDFAKHLNTIISGSENYNKEVYDNLFDEYEYLNG
jgi:CBS domain-containing protein